MDSRIALKTGTRLQLKGKEAPVTYTIGGEMGRGASCIVYDATYETVLGDVKHVRIKECYPFKLRIAREDSGRLTADEAVSALFEEEKAAVADNFSVVNRLFYSEGLYDSMVNSTDILFGNNTVYIVSAYSGKHTLARYRPGSLKECVELTKNTAYVIRKIHGQGYLYLDTKPENVLVIEGMVSRIQLFDFDSLWPMSGQKKRTGEEPGRISFTKGFAALELQSGRMNSLGPYTDAYGIGALLFWLLFGRAPDSFDGLPKAEYPFETAGYMDVPYRDSLFPLLTEFFRRSLAAWHPDRYQSMDEVISALTLIEKNADITEPYLISSVILPPACFFGRESELRSIGEWWATGRNPVLYVTGMGGIGKSTLVKQFISTLDEAPDAVLYFPDPGNLRASFIDDTVVQLNTVERRSEETDEEYGRRKTRELRKVLARQRVLAVIDNLTDGEDPYLDELKKMGWKLILISRAAAPAGCESLKLEAILDPAVLRSLFERNLGRRLASEELGALHQITDDVGGNTLLVELLAKQIASSALTMETAAGLLRAQGLSDVAGEEVCLSRDDVVVRGTVKDLLGEIFRTDGLSGGEQAALKLLFLFGPEGTRAEEFRRLSGAEDLNTVNRLSRLGWIRREGPMLCMHPVIAELADDLPFPGPVRRSVSTAAELLYKELDREPDPKNALVRAGIRGAGQSRRKKEQAGRKSAPAPKTPAELRRTTDMARSLLRGCEAEEALIGSEALVNLRKAMIDNISAEYADVRLAETDRLIDICRRNRYRIPVPVHLRLLEGKARIFEDRGEPEMALEVLREAEKAAKRSPGRRTKAMLHDMAAQYYESKLYAEDRDEDKEQYLRHRLLAVNCTRAAAPYEGRERELCARLLSRVIACIRLVPEADLESLLEEAEALTDTVLRNDTECVYGLAMAKAWVLAEKYGDMTAAERFLAVGREKAKELSDTPLDYMDRVLIPSAQMYFDNDDFPTAIRGLEEGVKLCDENPGLDPYIRKKYDLLAYMLEVSIAAGDAEAVARLRERLENEREQHAETELPDYMTPYLRERLAEMEPER